MSTPAPAFGETTNQTNRTNLGSHSRVIFARVNYKCGKEYMCDGTLAEVTATLKTARKNHKAVVGMKIFGAGKLVAPEEKDASLQFVLGGDLVDAITIGMLDTDQVDDTLARIARVSRG